MDTSTRPMLTPEDRAEVTWDWVWLAAASGIVFAVLVVVTFILSGAPPALDDSPEKINAYFANHRSDVLRTTFVGALAAFFILWFAAVLRSVLHRAEGGTGRLANLSFAGAVATTPLILMGDVAYSAIALHLAKQPTPDLVLSQTLFDFGNLAYAAAAIPQAVFLAAAGIVMVRTGAIHRLLGWLALVAAAVFLVASAARLSDDSPLWIVSLVGLVLFLVWIVIVSILLLTRLKPAPAVRSAR
jgi:hypothetical protein